MKKVLTLIACIIFLISVFSTPAFSDEGRFFVGPQLGKVDVKIKSEYTFDLITLSDDNLETGVAGGYRFNSGWQVEGLYLVNDSIDIFDIGDTFNIDQFQLMTGYSWQINRGIRLVPKVGLSFWQLDAEQGIFLNPGDEERRKFDGKDFVWSLNIEVPINKLLLLHFSYANNQYDFGEMESLSAGVKFEF